MHWGNKNKMIFLALMILCNGIVVLGWWLVKMNGEISGSFPISITSFLGIMDILFVWLVFLFPQLQKNRIPRK